MDGNGGQKFSMHTGKFTLSDKLFPWLFLQCRTPQYHDTRMSRLF
jgi:hypothetical protein